MPIVPSVYMAPPLCRYALLGSQRVQILVADLGSALKHIFDLGFVLLDLEGQLSISPESSSRGIHTVIKTEPWAQFPVGPPMKKKLGKFGVLMLR